MLTNSALRKTTTLLLLVSSFFILPTAAEAATRYVSPSGTDSGDCSTQASACALPSYAISKADAGDTVQVGAGNYEDHISLDKNISVVGAGTDQVVISPPPGMVYTPADQGFNYAIVAVPSGIEADFSDLTISGPDPDGNHCGTTGNAGDHALLDNGFLVNGGTLNLDNVDVLNIRENPLGNCQHDNALRYLNSAEGTLNNVLVEGYQKTGMIFSYNSNVTVTNSTIIGDPTQTQLAQNGVQVSSGAIADFHGNTIKDNTCSASSICDSTQEVGLFLYAPGAGGNYSDNVLSGNDINLYSYLGVPSNSAMRYTDNTITKAKMIGAYLGAGDPVFAGNTVTDNPSGVYTEGYAGQSPPAAPLISSNNIDDNDTGLQIADDGNAPVGYGPIIHGNRIVSNDTGAEVLTGSTDNYDLSENWWGCNAGPNNTGCDTTVADGGSLVTEPHLVLRITAPADGEGGSEVAASADTWYDSDGTDYHGVATLPDIPIHFSADHSAGVNPGDPVSNDGAAATSVSLPQNLTTVNVSAKLDNQTVSTQITVTGAAPVGSPPSVQSSGGSSFTATPGPTSGSGTVSYSYQWQLCDSSGENCSDIPGATMSTYTVDNPEWDGKQLRVVVTAHNFVGDDTQISEPATIHITAPVQPVTPEKPSASAPTPPPAEAAPPGAKLINTRQVKIIPAPNGWSVFAEPGSWHGSQPISYQNTWLVCSGSGRGCKATDNHGNAFKHDKNLGGKSLRLQTVAKNADNTAVSVSLAVKINEKGYAPSGGRCRAKGASFNFTLGYKNHAVSKAVVTSGAGKLSPIKKSADRWTYKIKLADVGGHRTVVRAFYQNSTGQDSFKTRAFLTCK